MTDSAGFTRPVIPLGNVSGSQNNPNEKSSSEQYIPLDREIQEEEEQFKKSEFVDRSAQLRASLSSLAMINAPKVIRPKKDKPAL